MAQKIQTAERVSQSDVSDNFVYQRSYLAYVEAAKLVSGKVLEIGTGSGYGIELISKNADSFLTIDKFESAVGAEASKNIENVEFRQMNVPPFNGIEDNTFDFVVSFQVIEHIKPDDQYVKEIHRVLKPGGKFIVTTPNIKMSLSRNPWHIREYTVQGLKDVLLKDFKSVDAKGVFGNEIAMKYYAENKASVRKIMKYDIFNLQYNLPRWMLQVPYDILNRRNRNSLSDKGAHIKLEDYFVAEANDECIDLFFIAEK